MLPTTSICMATPFQFKLDITVSIYELCSDCLYIWFLVRVAGFFCYFDADFGPRIKPIPDRTDRKHPLIVRLGKLQPRP